VKKEDSLNPNPVPVDRTTERHRSRVRRPEQGDGKRWTVNELEVIFLNYLPEGR
jgi:hypothetical protein